MQEGITSPTIKKTKEEKNSASFVITPLFPGYGVTIGNSLRRILYSSLEGAAIYAIKVDGASHEFSTLPGVREDLIQIILSLKQVGLKIHEGKEATLKLNVKGPKEVTAADIKTPASVEIINSKQSIASLGKTGKLSMELKVNSGLGYVPVEAREGEKYPIGTIAIDAVYSPVKKVNHSVESTRVGKITNYDKLTVDITTNGTITPEEALKKSANILINQLKLIEDFKAKTKREKEEKATPNDRQAEKETRGAKEKVQDIKSKKIQEAGFSNRTCNALVNNKVKTVAGLARLSEDTLGEMKGLGAKGVKEIKKKLSSWGLD